MVNAVSDAPLTLIAAVARNGVMGRDGKLPWDLPEDRMKMLQTLGVTPGMPMETAQDVMRKHGIQPNDATREALEAIANMEAQKESK